MVYFQNDLPPCKVYLSHNVLLLFAAIIRGVSIFVVVYHVTKSDWLYQVNWLLFLDQNWYEIWVAKTPHFLVLLLDDCSGNYLIYFVLINVHLYTCLPSSPGIAGILYGIFVTPLDWCKELAQVGVQDCTWNLFSTLFHDARIRHQNQVLGNTMLKFLKFGNPEFMAIDHILQVPFPVVLFFILTVCRWLAELSLLNLKQFKSNFWWMSLYCYCLFSSERTAAPEMWRWEQKVWLGTCFAGRNFHYASVNQIQQRFLNNRCCCLYILGKILLKWVAFMLAFRREMYILQISSSQVKVHPENFRTRYWREPAEASESADW